MMPTTDQLYAPPNGLGAHRMTTVAMLAGGEQDPEPLALLMRRAGMQVSILEYDAGLRRHRSRVDVLVFACEGLEAADLDMVAAVADGLGAERRVIVAARPIQGHVIRRALRSRIEGLVLGDEADRALVPTIHAVLAYQVVLPASDRARLETPLLSHREREVLTMAVDGLKNDEIGRRLFLATSTVKSHLSSAFAKLDVSSRKEAAAVLHDLISPDQAFSPEATPASARRFDR
jgi:DNA-binding NarL/FixJ family response regulator